MTDGSNLGINAEQAMRAILGGEEPEGEPETREQIRARLADVPRVQDITETANGLVYHGQSLGMTYASCTDVATRAVLDFMEAFPDLADAPCNNEYAPDAWQGFTGNGDFPTPTRIGMWDLMKERGYNLAALGLTGFMWGFAYNTARWLRYEQPGANPALLDV